MRWLFGVIAALSVALGTATPAGATPLGGGAELGCVGEGKDACDIGFTVTRIEEDVACSDPAHPLGPDEQWLRFDVDFDPLRHPFQTTWSSSAFLIENWRVDGIRVVLSEKCSFAPSVTSALPDPFIKPIDVGYSLNGRKAVVIAPKNATTLSLTAPDDSHWEWSIL
jgi:hypothetical protein